MRLASDFSTNRTPPLVLLVDDQEPCLRLLRDVVESAGYRCVTANSALDALTRCDERKPEAVVTDLDMPDLDGAVLASRIKARYPSIPLLLVTGQDLQDHSIGPLRAVFAEILLKPLDPKRLLDVLEATLRAAGHGSDNLVHSKDERLTGTE